MRDLIFDIGANNGDDTAFYLKKGFRVVAIEADPALAQKLNDLCGLPLHSKIF